MATLCRATGILGATGAQFACGIDSTSEVVEGFPRDPLLLELPDGRISVQSAIPTLPLAYVSRGEQKIFVDYESRISVSVLVAAHISVSSGLWRIPLLGDDVRVPIDAGDPEREFSEHDISEWDPGLLPEEGDYRVQMGSPIQTEISLECAPVLPERGWVSGGPWPVERCHNSELGLCREVFTPVGRGLKHDFKSYRTCAEKGQQVQFLSWIVPCI